MSVNVRSRGEKLDGFATVEPVVLFKGFKNDSW